MIGYNSIIKFGRHWVIENIIQIIAKDPVARSYFLEVGAGWNLLCLRNFVFGPALTRRKQKYDSISARR
jgi:hypothetical protein